MEPLYIMAAFTSAVYISLEQHLRTSAPAVSPHAVVSPVRGQSGWRVAMSARHFHIPGVTADAASR
jgi:hypothetical protein